MNLYVLKFRHYSQKDSKEGIITYLVADSDEQIYEWLKTEPEINDDNIFNSYEYKEEENKYFDIYDLDCNVIGKETFKERMIRLHGEMYDEESDVSDTYYGVTHYGWELINTDVYYTDIIHAQRSLKINIVDLCLKINIVDLSCNSIQPLEVIYNSDLGHFDGLTNGKIYNVIKELESQYIVQNDYDSTSTINKKKFIVKE